MTEQKRFTLRMDGELFEYIKKRADENKRSIAKEIEYILEKNINLEKESKSE